MRGLSEKSFCLIVILALYGPPWLQMKTKEFLAEVSRSQIGLSRKSGKTNTTHLQFQLNISFYQNRLKVGHNFSIRSKFKNPSWHFLDIYAL